MIEYRPQVLGLQGAESAVNAGRGGLCVSQAPPPSPQPHRCLPARYNKEPGVGRVIDGRHDCGREHCGDPAIKYVRSQHEGLGTRVQGPCTPIQQSKLQSAKSATPRTPAPLGSPPTQTRIGCSKGWEGVGLYRRCRTPPARRPFGAYWLGRVLGAAAAGVAQPERWGGKEPQRMQPAETSACPSCTTAAPAAAPALLPSSN